MNQKLEVSSKIKSMLVGCGTCKYACTFEKDVLYPKEKVNLKIEIDNSKCSKKIDKYKVKLLRRTQVINLKSVKPIYTNDQIIFSKKIDANCKGKASEEQTLELDIPNTIFVSEEEEQRIKVPIHEKPLVLGPSSSISGKLFKVQYVL